MEERTRFVTPEIQSVHLSKNEYDLEEDASESTPSLSAGTVSSLELGRRYHHPTNKCSRCRLLFVFLLILLIGGVGVAVWQGINLGQVWNNIVQSMEKDNANSTQNDELAFSDGNELGLLENLENDEDSGDNSTDSNRTYQLDGLNWFHTEARLKAFQASCIERMSNKTLSPALRDVARADCGWDYRPPALNDAVRSRKWTVAFVGNGWTERTMELAGATEGNSCPTWPGCSFVHVPNVAVATQAKADVIVVLSYQHRLVEIASRSANGTLASIKKDGSVMNPIKVLYWREAYWGDSPPEWKQREIFDLEMGVHYTAALKNPNFQIQPSFLLQGVHQDVKTTAIIASLISDCRTSSKRQSIVNKLVQYLGKSRVHQYGICGTMELPGHSVWSAMKLLARYKFYMAFENTIQTGYTTCVLYKDVIWVAQLTGTNFREKLYYSLMLPLIPIYYGDPDVKNITITPSFIKVLDYPNIKSLASHILFLDHHPEEYAKYHEWRTRPELFTKEYLDDMALNFPGPEEVRQNLYYPSKILSPRRAVACRLCDETFLRKRMENRQYVTKSFNTSQVDRYLKTGKFDP